MKKPFHRLTIDLDEKAFKKLKEYADAEERSVSKQAKVLLLQQIEIQLDS